METVSKEDFDTIADLCEKAQQRALRYALALGEIEDIWNERRDGAGEMADIARKALDNC